MGMDGVKWDAWGKVVWLLDSLARPSHHDFNEKKGLQCPTNQDMAQPGTKLRHIFAREAWSFVFKEKLWLFKEMWHSPPHVPRYGATWGQVAPYLGSWEAGGLACEENMLGQRGRGRLGVDGL